MLLKSATEKFYKTGRRNEIQFFSWRQQVDLASKAAGERDIFVLFKTATEQPYRAGGRKRKSASFVEATGRLGRKHSGRKDFFISLSPPSGPVKLL